MLNSATKESEILHRRSEQFDLACQTTKEPASGKALNNAIKLVEKTRENTQSFMYLPRKSSVAIPAYG
jgi:hypothetical protein